MGTGDIPSEIETRFQLALDVGDVEGVLSAAADLQGTGRPAEGAVWLAKAWQKLPEAPRLANRLLELHLRYHNWASFDAVAAEALDRHPGDAELHYTLGCGWESRAAWDRAAEAFGRAYELGTDEVEAVQRQARALRLDGRPKEALAVVERALKEHPNEATLHAVTGYVWIELDKPAKAAQAFERALSHQPDWQPYLDDLAGALMLAERWEEAARAARRSLAIRKRSERAWTVFAIAYQRLGDAERADLGYRNAIRAARSPSRAQGNYGLFLAKHPARMLEAIRMLKAANRAHPDWPEVAAALERLTT
jgi:Tfp pilus assembly protein PilF